jgi:HD domain
MRCSGDPYITHPVAVATILAGFDEAGEVDDQLLCAAILHDAVAFTPYTLAELRREFGAGIAAIAAEHAALDRLRRRPEREAALVMARITSADPRVAAAMMAHRLHNMQTIQFLPQAKQVRKAREVLDTYLPAAGELHMTTVRSELQTLACAALTRNQPLQPPRRRLIVALDIESSTTRPDPVKADLRTPFRLLDAPPVKTALKTAPGSLLLVISGNVHDTLTCGSGQTSCYRLVTVQVAGHEYRGWIHVPA